jgi:hypothetical protein
VNYAYYHPDLVGNIAQEFDVLQEATELLGYALRRWPEGWETEVYALMGANPAEAYKKLGKLCAEEGLGDELSPAVLWTYFNYELNALFNLEPISVKDFLYDIDETADQYLVNFLGRLSPAYYFKNSYGSSRKEWLIGSKLVSQTDLERGVLQVWRVNRDRIDAMAP